MNHTSKDGGWVCPICKENFRTRKLFYAHKKESHSQNRLDVKENRTCKYCNYTMFTTSGGIKNHEMYCEKNPNHKKLNYEWCRTVEFKKHQSELMKERHKTGKAKSFSSRNKIPHSYPEIWFIKFLEKYFQIKENVEYKTEMKFDKYFLDFAWINKKKCIEIDGQQHQRDEKRKESDLKKDNLLKQNGWKVLRLSWKWIMEQHFIHIKELYSIVYDFIK